MLWSCLYLHFHYYLSPAERKILAYIVLGYANNAIAEATYTSVKGIERHIRGIFAKLCLNKKYKQQYTEIARFESRVFVSQLADLCWSA